LEVEGMWSQKGWSIERTAAFLHHLGHRSQQPLPPDYPDMAYLKRHQSV
jgi:hypothetical protein